MIDSYGAVIKPLPPLYTQEHAAMSIMPCLDRPVDAIVHHIADELPPTARQLNIYAVPGGTWLYERTNEQSA
jgi:hypothetical protein